VSARNIGRFLRRKSNLLTWAVTSDYLEEHIQTDGLVFSTGLRHSLARKSI